MNKDQMFILFTIFNILFGLSGIGLIVISFFMIIKIKFRALPFILIVIGLIMILIMILGLKSRKKIEFLIMYLIFIMIILLFYGFLSVMFIAFPEKLINYLKDKVYEENFDFKNINNYNLDLFIASSVVAFCCLLTFIAGIIYCKKLKKNKNKKRTEQNDDDILRGLDYSMPLNDSTK